MVRRYNRVLDRFKIEFKCNVQPNEGTGLRDFKPNRHYTGRSYNGLFEISTDWGSGRPTVLLDKKTFDRYFEIEAVQEEENELAMQI